MVQNISDLHKLRACVRKVNINGMDVEVKSLTFTELSKFAELLEQKKNDEAIEYMLLTSLRKTMVVNEGGNTRVANDNEIKEFINELEASSTVELIKEIQRASGIKIDAIDDKKKEP